jgi:hypothetical protein
VLYYMVSRAAAISAPSLRTLRDTIVPRIVGNGAFESPLQAALASATVLNLGEDPRLLDRRITLLLASQQADGSWPAEALFADPANAYGSAELTTALCLEALAKYASAARRSRSS